ncbi:hypothetical protein HAHE_09680 [Haloferula helveola]|uniref:DUF1622 domain-containing protein n=1 Tax=Haloferula helveola TaxID=490095 RepID=A0ABN6H6E2_9BACT|nr:hypothetical protein HAHE_09680 [Haloferula helveola]
MRTFCKWWSVGVGAMDAATGILLILWPEWVLGMLGVEGVGVESMVFLRWIGVFVGSVGLSYGLALREQRQGKTVWQFTGLVRAGVAVFVTTSILRGSLDRAWIGVAATDALVAAVQAWGLRKEWWR